MCQSFGRLNLIFHRFAVIGWHFVVPRERSINSEKHEIRAIRQPLPPLALQFNAIEMCTRTFPRTFMTVN